MIEGKWHRKVREEIFEGLKIRNPNVYTSHSDYSKLELYRGDIERKNCLSDADIVVFDSRHEKIRQIIEIENDINPKKIMGIVLATHFCNKCRIKKKDYPLKDIHLRIIYRRVKEKSKKPLKLEVMKKPLTDILRNTEGCLSKFDWEEHI